MSLCFFLIHLNKITIEIICIISSNNRILGTIDPAKLADTPMKKKNQFRNHWKWQKCEPANLVFFSKK